MTSRLRSRQPTGDVRVDRELRNMSLFVDQQASRITALEALNAAPAPTVAVPRDTSVHLGERNEFANLVTKKDTPVNGDLLLSEDSVDGFRKKKVTVGDMVRRGPVVTITEDTTLDASHTTVLLDATNVAFKVSLPPAAATLGREYELKMIGNTPNDVTVVPDGSDTVEFGSTLVLTVQGEAVQLRATGTGWNVF